MDNNQNQPNNKGNVLPGNANQSPGPVMSPAPPKPVKSKYSLLGIFMAIILFGVMVMLCERIIFDLNRLVNPVIDKGYTESMNQYQGALRRGYEYSAPQLQSSKMLSESMGVSPNTRIYYKASEKGRYMMWKLIIHACVIIPIFVLSFVLFYFRKKNKQLRPLLISFMFFAFWMIFHLLGETINFVMDEYRNIAIYVILVILAAVFGVLAYYTQTKYEKKEGEA
ncbi:MAG: hypothetical protein U9O20_04095 [Patescibacteria group bacterium]|nr:hypothetical protein [Patescibacteria group bacterium]